MNSEIKRLVAISIVVLFFTVSLSVSNTFAAERSVLDALIEEAIANNPEIQAFRKRYFSRRARIKPEGMLDDPTLKLQMMDIPEDSPLTITDSTVNKLSLQQEFPFFGKLSLKEDIASKDALAVEQELKYKELDIIKRVKDAYYDYYFIISSIKITLELQGIIMQIIKVADIKYSTGLASQHDVIKAQVEHSILEESLINLYAEKGIEMARINLLLNRKVDAVVPDPDEGIRAETIELDLEELRVEVIENNPGLRAVMHEVESGELATALAKKDYYPNFVLGAAYSQKDSIDDAWEGIMGINIPIWRSKYDRRVTEQRENTGAIRSRLVADRNFRLLDLETSFEGFERARDVVLLYETGLVPQTELSFDSAMASYGKGTIDFFALLDSERFLLKTRLDYIKTIVAYNKVLAAIEKLIGREIIAGTGGRSQGS